MHGRIISGIGSYSPEITRLEVELAKQRSKAPNTFLKSNQQRQLEQILETKKRMQAKREALAASVNNPGDALDVLAARAEAQDLARRMKGAGYTPQQIQAAVTPMLVNPSSTITGRRERRKARKEARKERRAERKAAGKGIFRKIGAAVKKGAQFVYKGAAKLNPVLAGARVAVLSLVRQNAGGLADTFRQAGAEKMRKRWENLGGDFAKLQQAVEKGAGQRITGLVEHDDVIGVAPVAAAGVGKLWEVAKPIIEKLLSVLGIGVSKELEQALDIPDSPETKAIRMQADDALDPTTGGGPGANGGGAAISPLLLAGIAAALIFVTR